MRRGPCWDRRPCRRPCRRVCRSLRLRFRGSSSRCTPKEIAWCYCTALRRGLCLLGLSCSWPLPGSCLLGRANDFLLVTVRLHDDLLLARSLPTPLPAQSNTTNVSKSQQQSQKLTPSIVSQRTVDAPAGRNGWLCLACKESKQRETDQKKGICRSNARTAGHPFIRVEGGEETAERTLSRATSLRRLQVKHQYKCLQKDYTTVTCHTRARTGRPSGYDSNGRLARNPRPAAVGHAGAVESTLIDTILNCPGVDAHFRLRRTGGCPYPTGGSEN